ncbi:MAG: hypothetical protein J6W24_07385 [Prevotella sp.]|nr:hypothetical protein [Prevotella sp.]
MHSAQFTVIVAKRIVGLKARIVGASAPYRRPSGRIVTKSDILLRKQGVALLCCISVGTDVEE